MVPDDLAAVRTRFAAWLRDGAVPDQPSRDEVVALLDAVRRRRFAKALKPDQLSPWTELVVRLVERARYSLGELLLSREQTDPDTVAFRVLGPSRVDLTVAGLGPASRSIARGLLSLLGPDPSARVALLAGNCLDCALTDLACLTNGIVNARLPANAVAAHVEYMLRHSQSRVLVVSDDEQFAKVRGSLGALPDLRHVVALSGATAARHGLMSLQELVALGASADDGARETRARSVAMRELATIMYTSGTTGMPKGIGFSQANIVTKRFCRGFALPELGEGDVFLSYLPLFHTFGRWLELIGTLYWGATYTFARDPSISTLVEDLASVRPSVFISVPKKWEELYDQARRDAATDDPVAIAGALQELAGGNLRTGLSAAGFLEPLVFKTVQRAGIDLCSGYGTTEATGGITMTPPQRYREGSIGVPLPGIDTRIEEDGELLVRGPYVMEGYFRPEDGLSGIDADGWFSTGDIVRADEDGYLWIVDRKKEIYKNRKGQTIAPQRVENLFRDFDVVAQAFVVGDRRDFNTLLVWPNYEAHPELGRLAPVDLRSMLASLVVSANKFLAPFERVVAFQLLPRALSEQHGELTPKGSFKRQVIEQRWSELIEPMYRHSHLELAVGDTLVRIPNWLLRELGVLRTEVDCTEGVLRARDRALELRPAGSGQLRLGDFTYAVRGGGLDLGALVSSPSQWLGNDALRGFLGDETLVAVTARRKERAGELELVEARAATGPAADLAALVRGEEVTLLSLHAAASMLASGDPGAALAVLHLQRGLQQPDLVLAALCRSLLLRVAGVPSEELRRAALLAVLRDPEHREHARTLSLFLARPGPPLLGDPELARLADEGLPDAELVSLLERLAAFSATGAQPGRDSASDRAVVVGVIRLLSVYAIRHPAWYGRVRVALARLALHTQPEVAARADEELDRLQLGFRAWIGPNIRLATDRSTTREYGWGEVVVFDHAVSQRHREVMLHAIADTSLVRESVFLFAGQLVSLADLAPAGVTIAHLGSNHGKSVFRASVQTRAGTQCDFAINVADDQPPAALRDEVRWLLAAGAPPRLVEDFGGWYPEHGMFTEEFIAGETVDRQVERLSALGEHDRLRAQWPFLVWTAFAAHVDFWLRTRKRFSLEPSPSNIIVPSHDYQVGARIVSASVHASCESLSALMDRFRVQFIAPLEARHRGLGEHRAETLLSAAAEVAGLPDILAWLELEPAGAADVLEFARALRTRGITPQKLYFAIQRYGRWLAGNPDATVEARGAMLHELWDAYGLEEVELRYPDARLRFFRDTVFSAARPQIAEGIETLMREAREAGNMAPDRLVERIAGLRASSHPTADEDYFLARVAWRHLEPDDDASLVVLPAGERRLNDVMVTITDATGTRFRLRAPTSPREVARLLHLFQAANLQVAFSPEHEFLVVVDPVDRVIGGLFYRPAGERLVHMEKIVVQRDHRRRGVSDALMHEFLRRLQSRGVSGVVTGFFRPAYMQRFGFKLEARFAGMFRDLRVPLERPRSHRPPPIPD